MPDSISKQINYDTLQMVQPSFINEHLHYQESDVLFSAEIAGTSGYIYTLLEHQSTPDKLMPVRLLRYVGEVLHMHLKNMAAQDLPSLPLPMVVPLVLYNGVKPYNCAKDLFSLFGANAKLMRDIFCNDFNLIDLSKIEDVDLKQDIWGGLMCFIMKHIYEKDIIPYLEEAQDFFRELITMGASNFVTSMLTYVIDAGSIVEHNRLNKFLSNTLPRRVGAEIMTYADRLRAEGIEQGIEQGIRKGMETGISRGIVHGQQLEKINLAKKLLAAGADVKYVANITELPVTQLQELCAN